VTGRAGEWRLAPTSALLAQAPDMALSSHVIPAALLYYALFSLFFSRQLKNLFTNMRRGVPTAVYMAMMVCTLWVAFAPVCSPCFSPFWWLWPRSAPFCLSLSPSLAFFWGHWPRSALFCLALSPLARFILSLLYLLSLSLSLSLSFSPSLSLTCVPS
jgi:hypothetical protein